LPLVQRYHAELEYCELPNGRDKPEWPANFRPSDLSLRKETSWSSIKSGSCLKQLACEGLHQGACAVIQVYNKLPQTQRGTSQHSHDCQLCSGRVLQQHPWSIEMQLGKQPHGLRRRVTQHSTHRQGVASSPSHTRQQHVSRSCKSAMMI
jgi:hypothetical protein